MQQRGAFCKVGAALKDLLHSLQGQGAGKSGLPAGVRSILLLFSHMRPPFPLYSPLDLEIYAEKQKVPNACSKALGTFC